MPNICISARRRKKAMRWNRWLTTTRQDENSECLVYEELKNGVLNRPIGGGDPSPVKCQEEKTAPRMGTLYCYICKAVPFDFITDRRPKYHMQLQRGLFPDSARGTMRTSLLISPQISFPWSRSSTFTISAGARKLPSVTWSIPSEPQTFIPSLQNTLSLRSSAGWPCITFAPL